MAKRKWSVGSQVTVCGALALWSTLAQADQVGCVTTEWKLIRVPITGFASRVSDPKVPGVTCHVSQARTGGGLNLDEVIDALHVSDRGDASCASERWRMEAVLERVEAKMTELRSVRTEIRRVLDACDSGRCVFAEPEDSTSSA